jgi:secretion/DNA translocation related TadE-like protein
MTQLATDSRESGSATIWVLGMSAVVAAAAAVVLTAGLVSIVRQRATTTADLAALAGARAATSGTDPCATAAVVAAAQHAALTGCVEAGDGSVEVQIEQPLTGALAGRGAVRVRARAGPAGAP